MFVVAIITVLIPVFLSFHDSLFSSSGRPPLLSDPEWPSKMADTFSVADWSIDNWRVENDLSDMSYDQAQQQFVFKFDAKRIYTHYLVKFVVPLVLIVMMSWVVFWIDPVESGSQLSVAVTVGLCQPERGGYHFALCQSPAIGARQAHRRDLSCAVSRAVPVICQLGAECQLTGPGDSPRGFESEAAS